MKKLTLQDVEVLSPGVQVKKLISIRYGTIRAFAEDINMNYDTVRQYLKERKLGSNTFRLRLVEKLGGLNEIVVPEAEQVKISVDTVTKDFKIYTEKEDIKVLETLLVYAEKYNLHKEIIMSERNIAMYYFFNQNSRSAITHIKLAIDKSLEFNEPSCEVFCRAELGLMFFYDRNYLLSKNQFEKIREIIRSYNKIDVKSLFKYHYSFGILLNNIKEHKRARNHFSKASEFAQSDVDKGRAIMNIGLSYMRAKMYDISLEYLTKALSYMEDSDEKKLIVYNNIAETYKNMGLYSKALSNINKALEFKCNYSQDYFMAFKTYLEIEILMGGEEKGLRKLVDLIEEHLEKFVASEFILDSIRTVIDLSTKFKAVSILRELHYVILKYIDKSEESNIEYIEELEKMLGKISRNFKQLI